MTVICISTSCGIGFGVFDEDIEVAVVVEDAGVDQFEFGIVLAAAAVFVDELGVGEFALRILVEHFQIGVRWQRIEIPVALFDIFAVIALAVGEAEEALFENWIVLVPKGQGLIELAVIVADAGQAVVAPAVGAAAGVIVGEIFPGGAAGAVIFADGAPLAFAGIGAPLTPGLLGRGWLRRVGVVRNS